MHNLGIGGLIVLLYGNPILVMSLWVIRLAGERQASPSWRSVASWVSLSLVTAAVSVFWIATLTNAYPQPNAIAALRLGFRISLASAAGAVVTSLFAKGKGRTWAAISAFIVPLNWIMWAAFQ